MTIKRIIRRRRLTPEETAKYKTVREQVEQELSDLIARHHARLSLRNQMKESLPESGRTNDPG
jgi:hypothetical protein